MKTNKQIQIILFMILSISLVLSSNRESTTFVISDTINPVVDQPRIHDLTDHAPMTIDTDADFETYGLPGIGESYNPYRIENLNITTNGDYCLNFGGYTTKYFIIQNCFLKTDTNYAIYVGKYSTIGEGTVDIYNNVIISTGNLGIKLDGVVNGKVRENYLVDLDYGISLDNSNFTYIKDNTIAAEVGIIATDSVGIIIDGNTCTDTTDKGINIINTNSTVIKNNICSTSLLGIYVRDSSMVNVTNNYLTENFYGMSVQGSAGCLITNNSFDTSTSYGLTMSTSPGLNKIYFNNFNNNNLAGTTVQASDTIGDQWYDDVRLVGNFWSGWGPEYGPYAIDGGAGSQDLYPLGSVPSIPEYSNSYFFLFILTMFFSVSLIIIIKRKH